MDSFPRQVQLPAFPSPIIKRVCDLVNCSDSIPACQTLNVVRHEGKIFMALGQNPDDGKLILGEKVSDSTACRLTEHYMNAHEEEA